MSCENALVKELLNYCRILPAMCVYRYGSMRIFLIRSIINKFVLFQKVMDIRYGVEHQNINE